MSDAIECDACGAVVERETLAFDIETGQRVVGGNIVDPEGNTHDWGHREVYGDLCSECAAPVIDELNEVLKQHSEDNDE